MHILPLSYQVNMARQQGTDRYRTFSERLETFYNWPINGISIRKLAEVGFYCIGDGDTVKCFMCHVEIGNWTQTDQPLLEHLKYSPDCPFVKRSKLTDDHMKHLVTEGYKKLYNKYTFADNRNLVCQRLAKFEKAYSLPNEIAAEENTTRELSRNEEGLMSTEGARSSMLKGHGYSQGLQTNALSSNHLPSITNHGHEVYFFWGVSEV